MTKCYLRNSFTQQFHAAHFPPAFYILRSVVVSNPIIRQTLYPNVQILMHDDSLAHWQLRIRCSSRLHDIETMGFRRMKPIPWVLAEWNYTMGLNKAATVFEYTRINTHDTNWNITSPSHIRYLGGDTWDYVFDKGCIETGIFTGPNA